MTPPSPSEGATLRCANCGHKRTKHSNTGSECFGAKTTCDCPGWTAPSEGAKVPDPTMQKLRALFNDPLRDVTPDDGYNAARSNRRESRCANCQWFGGGDCRRHAPIGNRDPKNGGGAIWPQVSHFDSCGDFTFRPLTHHEAQSYTPPAPDPQSVLEKELP